MNKKLTAKILKRARALINKGWCQGNLAVNKNNTPVYYNEAVACKFCAEGAILRAEKELGTSGVFIFSEKLLQVDHTATWNDAEKRTKKQVLDRFSKAIKRLEKQK